MSHDVLQAATTCLPAGKLGAIERDFQNYPEGLSLTQFVNVMLKHVKVGTEEEKVTLVSRLCELFDQIDVNDDRTLEWAELTGFIVEQAMAFRSESSHEQFVEKHVVGLRPVAKDRVTCIKLIPIASKCVVAIGNGLQLYDVGNEHETGFRLLSELDLTVYASPEAAAAAGGGSDGGPDGPGGGGDGGSGGAAGRKGGGRRHGGVRPKHVAIIPVLDIIFYAERDLLIVLRGDLAVYFFKVPPKIMRSDTLNFVGRSTFPCPHYKLSYLHHAPEFGDAVSYIFTTECSNDIHVWQLRQDVKGTFSLIPHSVLQRHTDFVQDILTVYNADFTYLASAALDKKVHIWDPVHLEWVCTRTGHTSGVKCLAFDGDSILLSGGFSQEIIAWDLAAELDRPVFRMLGHASAICAIVAPSPERACSLDVNGNILWWDSRVTAPLDPRERCIQTISNHVDTYVSIELITATSNDVARRSANSALILGAGKRLHVYECVDNRPPEAPPSTAVYNTTSLSVVTVHDKDLKVWDAVRGELSRVLPGVCPGEVTALTFDKRKRRIVLADQHGHVSVHNYLNGTVMKRFPSCGMEVSCLQYVDDDETVIAGAWGGLLQIYDEKEPVGKAALLRNVKHAHDGDIRCLAFDYNMSLIATSAPGSLRVWDYQFLTCESDCSLAISPSATSDVTAMQFMQFHPFLVCGDVVGRVSLIPVRPAPADKQYTLGVQFNNSVRYNDRRLPHYLRTKPKVRDDESAESDVLAAAAAEFSADANTNTDLDAKHGTDGGEMPGHAEDNNGEDASSKPRRGIQQENDSGDDNEGDGHGTTTAEDETEPELSEAEIANLECEMEIPSSAAISCLAYEFDEFGGGELQPGVPAGRHLVYTGDEEGWVRVWDVSGHVLASGVPALQESDRIPAQRAYNSRSRVKRDGRNYATPVPIQSPSSRGASPTREADNRPDADADAPSASATSATSAAGVPLRTKESAPPNAEARLKRGSMIVREKTQLPAGVFLIHAWKAHHFYINSLELIRDNDTVSIMTASMDSSVRVWSREGTLLGILTRGRDVDTYRRSKWDVVIDTERREARAQARALRVLKDAKRELQDAAEEKLRREEELLAIKKLRSENGTPTTGRGSTAGSARFKESGYSMEMQTFSVPISGPAVPLEDARVVSVASSASVGGGDALAQSVSVAEERSDTSAGAAAGTEVAESKAAAGAVPAAGADVNAEATGQARASRGSTGSSRKSPAMFDNGDLGVPPHLDTQESAGRGLLWGLGGDTARSRDTDSVGEASTAGSDVASTLSKLLEEQVDPEEERNRIFAQLDGEANWKKSHKEMAEAKAKETAQALINAVTPKTKRKKKKKRKATMESANAIVPATRAPSRGQDNSSGEDEEDGNGALKQDKEDSMLASVSMEIKPLEPHTPSARKSARSQDAIQQELAHMEAQDEDNWEITSTNRQRALYANLHTELAKQGQHAATNVRSNEELIKLMQPSDFLQQRMPTAAAAPLLMLSDGLSRDDAHALIEAPGSIDSIQSRSSSAPLASSSRNRADTASPSSSPRNRPSWSMSGTLPAPDHDRAVEQLAESSDIGSPPTPGDDSRAPSRVRFAAVASDGELLDAANRREEPASAAQEEAAMMQASESAPVLQTQASQQQTGRRGSSAKGANKRRRRKGSGAVGGRRRSKKKGDAELDIGHLFVVPPALAEKQRRKEQQRKENTAIMAQAPGRRDRPSIKRGQSATSLKTSGPKPMRRQSSEWGLGTRRGGGTRTGVASGAVGDQTGLAALLQISMQQAAVQRKREGKVRLLMSMQGGGGDEDGNLFKTVTRNRPRARQRASIMDRVSFRANEHLSEHRFRASRSESMMRSSLASSTSGKSRDRGKKVGTIPYERGLHSRSNYGPYDREDMARVFAVLRTMETEGDDGYSHMMSAKRKKRRQRSSAESEDPGTMAAVAEARASLKHAEAGGARHKSGHEEAHIDVYALQHHEFFVTRDQYHDALAALLQLAQVRQTRTVSSGDALEALYPLMSKSDRRDAVYYYRIFDKPPPEDPLAKLKPRDPERVEMLRRLFKMYDLDNSGAVDATEIMDNLRRTRELYAKQQTVVDEQGTPSGGKQLDLSDVQRVIDSVDLDLNRELDEDEFVALFVDAL